MKNWWLIWMLLLTKPSAAQDSCLPRYDLPVQRVMLGSASVAYVEEGRGTPVLFVHGLGGNLSHWLKVVHLLSSKYRCIAIDLPGYGHSIKAFDSARVDQLQYYADMLLQFIRSKGLKNVLLAGHSMGAQVATIVALQDPKNVKRLALVAPAGLETFTAAEASLLRNATPATFFQNQEEPAIRYSYAQNFSTLPPDAEELIRDRLQLKKCPDFNRYTAAVSAGVKGMLSHPVSADLANIRQPVLILFGDGDKLIPNTILHRGLTRDSLIAAATKGIKQKKITTVPGAGHLVQFEKPADVSTALKQFFN